MKTLRNTLFVAIIFNLHFCFGINFTFLNLNDIPKKSSSTSAFAPPRVLSVEVSDDLITDEDAGGIFTITVTFDQAMNSSVSFTPTLTFDPDIIGTLTNPSAGSWSDGDTVFSRTYLINDIDVFVSNVEIDVTGAENAGGQIMSNYNPTSNFTIDTNGTLSIEEYLPGTSMVYPNPVKTLLYIDNIENLKSLKVYNTKGQLVVDTKKEKINFSDFVKGIYFLHINTQKGITIRKIIKK